MCNSLPTWKGWILILFFSLLQLKNSGVEKEKGISEKLRRKQQQVWNIWL